MLFTFWFMKVDVLLAFSRKAKSYHSVPSTFSVWDKLYVAVHQSESRREAAGLRRVCFVMLNPEAFWSQCKCLAKRLQAWLLLRCLDTDPGLRQCKQPWLAPSSCFKGGRSPGFSLVPSRYLGIIKTRVLTLYACVQAVDSTLVTFPSSF